MSVTKQMNGGAAGLCNYMTPVCVSMNTLTPSGANINLHDCNMHSTSEWKPNAPSHLNIIYPVCVFTVSVQQKESRKKRIH